MQYFSSTILKREAPPTTLLMYLFVGRKIETQILGTTGTIFRKADRYKEQWF